MNESLVTLTEDDGSTSLLDSARLDSDVRALVVVLMSEGSAGFRLWELKEDTKSVAYCRLVAIQAVTLFARWLLLECPAWRHGEALQRFRQFIQSARTEGIVIVPPFARAAPEAGNPATTTGVQTPEDE